MAQELHGRDKARGEAPAIGRNVGVSTTTKETSVDKKCGVYQILCAKTGWSYVGASVDITKRWGRHRELLNKGTHYNPKFQAAWAAHGPESFALEILEECVRPDRFKREAFWIAAKEPAVYNTNSKLGENRRESLTKPAWPEWSLHQHSSTSVRCVFSYNLM